MLPLLHRLGAALVLIIASSTGTASAGQPRVYGHDSAVLSAYLSSNGIHLATVCVDGSVNIWQTNDGTRTILRSADEGQTYSVFFAPDSQSLIMVRAGDPSIPVFGIKGAQWQECKAISLTGDPGFLLAAPAFSPDSRTFYVAYGLKVSDEPREPEAPKAPFQTRSTVVCCHLESARVTPSNLPILDAFAPGLAVSPDARTFYLTPWDKVLLFDIASGAKQHVFDVAGFSAIMFSPNGAYTCLASRRGILMPESLLKTRLSIWKKEGERFVGVPPTPTIVGTRCLPVFTPDSKHIVVADGNRNVSVFRLQDGALRATLPQRYPLRQLCFTDGRTLAAVSVRDNEAVLWTIEAVRRDWSEEGSPADGVDS